MGGFNAMGGMSTMTPEMQQKLLSMLQGISGTGNPGQGMPQGGQAQGQGMGQGMQPPGPAQPQMPRLGGNNATLPTGTGVATPRGIQPSMIPARQPQGVSGRGAIGMIIGGIMAAKQSSTQKKQQEAFVITKQYMAIAERDGEQAAQQFLADPKRHKLFDKALKDPNSPEYNGVQQAYQERTSQDEAKVKWQEMQAKVQQAQAQAQADKQRGQYWQQMGDAASKRGQVTPEDEYKQQNQNARQEAAIKARSEQSSNALKALNQRAQDKIASLEKIAANAQRGANQRAGMKQGNNQAINAMLREYKNIQSQIPSLDREQKAIQDDLVKNPMSSWLTGNSDVFQAKLQAIDVQRSVIENRLSTLDQNFDAMTKGGVIPRAQAPSAPAKSGGPVILDMSGDR